MTEAYLVAKDLTPEQKAKVAKSAEATRNYIENLIGGYQVIGDNISGFLKNRADDINRLTARDANNYIPPAYRNKIFEKKEFPQRQKINKRAEIIKHLTEEEQLKLEKQEQEQARQNAVNKVIANTPQIQATIINPAELPPVPKTEFNPNNFEIINPDGSTVVPNSIPTQEATSITPVQPQPQALLQQGQMQSALKEQEQIPELQEFVPNGERSKFINAIARGVNNFRNGFIENKYNGYNPSNLTANKFKIGDIEQNKGFMGRLGEAVGTGARKTQGMIKNPVSKGVLSGLATGLLTGNPFMGYIAGTGTALDTAKSDVYAKALDNMGITVPNGTFDFYNSNDFDKLSKPYFDKANLQNSMYKTANDIRSTNADIEYKQEQLKNSREKNQIEREKNEIDKAYKQGQIENRKTYNEILKENNKKIKNTTSNSNNPEYLKELNNFRTRANNSGLNDEDISLLTAQLMNKYPEEDVLKDVTAYLDYLKKLKSIYSNEDTGMKI